MKEEQKIQTKNTAGFMDSNVKHLYDAMISQGYTGLGDFSNFEGKMKDSGKRRMVYDYLIQDDYFSEIGDFSKFESALGYSPAERKDYVSQSSVNPAPIALRQEVDVPMKDQSEYVNPWTNSPDYNFESLRKKGKIETATPPPPTEYEKDSSFMNTWVGDAIQKLNAGGADLGAGIFGVLDKAAKGLESATGGLIPRGGAFKDISDIFKADAEFSRARSNRYNGKDFTDLWKEGNYMGAIGDIALQGVESLPMSIGAMAATMAGAPAAGLAGIGSIVASQKYDDLDQNNPNMGEFAKVSNAILTGTAESLSEMLGAGVSKAWMSTLFKTLGKEKAQEAIKRGIMGKMQEFYKKFGMFFEPVNEGIEEVSSTLAENITDKITGADPERDLTDGVLQSFVYGMGGGAYFTGAGALAKGAQYVADKIEGKQAQQPITDSNVTDQGVETPPLLTKSRFAEAEEQGRNMTDPGDIRTASKKMEETRLSLSGMVPGLVSTIESYVDDGASEAQVMSLLDGVNADARPLAEDFYADYLRISGLQDRIGEEIDNEVETYVANNITPYVTTNPDGQSIVTTATLSEGNEERPVYVRSIEGDKAVISDNGQDRMVSVKRLSDIVEQDAGHMRRTYEDQLLATRQSELDMTMHHNPKTQLPKPGLIVWNGDNAFILQGQDENGDWIAQPAAYDRETGQVTAKNGSSPAMPITENEILDLQDAIYDAQQVNVVSPEDDNVASADAEITSAPPVEDAINQPTSEIETEGAIDQIAQPSNVENPSMVMREDGTPDFVSSGTDMALDFLYDKYGDKMPRKIEVTRKSFDESLKKASDALEKAQEAYDDAPIGKEDKPEAALIKARQEYEAIKVEADFWANLDDDIKEASKKPGDVIAKEISVIGDPMSGEELAAMMLANGAIKLTRDSYKKETGAGNNETARMFGLFASPEKGGVNIERAGEILELADRENGTNFFDEEGWQGLGNITGVTLDGFKKWIDSSTRKTKPFYEYKGIKQEESDISKNNDSDNYSIVSSQYTTKKGKVLDMWLLKFGNELSKEQQRAAKELAKAEKGWYDREQRGFMMRSDESARRLADTILGDTDAVSDAQPISLEDTRRVVEPQKVNVENLIGDINDKGKAKLSDRTVTPSGNRLVTDERYAELRERMRKKLGGQMNMGVDPEILAIGTEMAVYHIEKGLRKFSDYSKAMIDDLGDAIRPYLKSFYNGARDLPEVGENGWDKDMTTYEDVRSFDVANFDKPVPDIMDAAETVVKETEIAGQASAAEKKIKNSRKKRTDNKDKPLPLYGNDLFTPNNIKDNEQGNSRADQGVGRKAREEDRGSERGGDRGGVHGSDVLDTERGRGIPISDSDKRPVVRNQNNFSFPEKGIELPSGDISKLKANIEAIETLKDVEDGQGKPTPEQQAKMSRYVGWGGLAEALNEGKYNARDNNWTKDRNWNDKYLRYYEKLKSLLSKEEFDSAVRSTTTSHYTPSEVVESLWGITEKLGFKGGNISEPAMGIGNIIGMMPRSISENSSISGFEIDSLSGRMAKALYPDANIKVQGYEKAFSPNSKDLVITNVPFGKNAPYDKVLDKQFRKKLGSSYNLHNYFILKGLLELKEGGLGVFVTSSATMDGADSKFREYVSGNGYDLVGAIRLPNDAFQKGAGTSVTADIVIFRKRKYGEPSNGIGFATTTQIGEGTYMEDGDKRSKPIMVNEYFSNHPDMMLGDMMTAYDAGSGGLYSGASQTLKAKPGADLSKELFNAIDNLPKNILSGVVETKGPEVVGDSTLKDGTITVQNGNVFVLDGDSLKPIKANPTFVHNGKTRKIADAVNDYNDIKKNLYDLIHDEQTKGVDPEPARKRLNKVYDAFVSKYGTLNRNKALDDIFAEDVEHGLPFSLETVRRVPSTTGKSMVWEVSKADGILNKRVSYPFELPTKADNVLDAVNISKSYKGNIDIPYISEITGMDEVNVTNEILEKGIAYRDPVTGNIIDKSEYLSGNVKDKLVEAKAALEDHPEFQKNVDDLEAVQPERIPYGEISYRLGTTWIPSEFINNFADNVLGISYANANFIPEIGEYILDKRAFITDYAKAGQFKTERMDAIDVFKAALNQRKPKVYDEIKYYEDGKQKTRRVVNEQETQAVAEKISDMSDKFVEYIDSKTMFHGRIEDVYNDKYNNYVLKKYDKPVFEHYPNANKNITLRDHQSKAVQRCLSESTLLAHQVGTGKTFTMITSAMEMRRLGIAKKPMIVVQNATLEDFVRDFYKLYPSAKILSPTKEERNADNRTRLFNLIATGDFDAIVVPQSFMAFIPDSEERKKAYIQKRIDDFEEAIDRIEDKALQERLKREAKSMRDSLEGIKKGKNVKGKAKTAETITAKTERILDRRTDNVMTFEQMGVDALFIDEAHNYKKIGFPSKMSNVKGIDTSASQRANSMLLKAQWISENNGGRNVVLATGTPITNTMAEVWTMMNFVAPDILDAYNINSFDEFATTFGTVEPSLEFTATGNFKIAERFKSYTNVPELIKAFRSHTDVVLTEDVKEFKEDKNIPKLKDNKMTNVIVEKNEDLEDVMQTLIKELEDYNKLTGKEKKDKSALPLVVFSKAKQAAIDLRLLNPTFPDNPDSKTNKVVDNVLRLYKESDKDKGTQLIFCDSYQSPSETPKMDLFDVDLSVPQFNLYNDIKEKLIKGGIPSNQIAIVGNYEGERRNALFDKVRNGDVRILIGSTEKMGVGVNVQDRLFALHHIDAPIRPMDFEQRNGRILRQGNLYATWDKPVNIVTYGVKGTLDATAYDRLRIKQNFINQMMKGDISSRVMEEQDDSDPSGMTFSEMAATLSGDKTAQLLFVAQNKLKKLQNSKRSDLNSKSSMRDSISNSKLRIQEYNSRKDIMERNANIVKENFPDGVESVTVKGNTFSDGISNELTPIIDDYYDRYTLDRNTPPLKISLNGGKGEAIVHFNEGMMVYSLYLGKEKLVENRDFSGGKGLMASIDRQLGIPAKSVSDIAAKIKAEENKIAGLEEAVKKPWGKEDELNAAQAEVNDLQRQLVEKAKAEDIQLESTLDVDGTLVKEEGETRFRFMGVDTTNNQDNVSSIESSINDWSNKLNTPVRVIHDVDDINDTDENMLARKRDSKGWYDTSTGEIVIVSPNSTSVGDAQRTFLHEVVGHHGLRELFRDDFDTFLDNVYRNANEDIRKNIIDRTKGNPLNLREATEEYLAELAERGFDNKAERSLWEKIKDSFLDMLRKAGISLDFKLSDNDLRYILWRSYKNLEQGNLMDVAEDIVMRNRLSLNNINLNENGSIARDIEPEKGKQPSETKGTGRELETIDGVDENGNESERDHIDKPRGVENAIDGTENATDRNGKKTDGQVDNDGDQLDGGDTGDRNGSVRDGIGGDRTVIGRAGSENKGRGVGESVREKTDDFSFAEKTIRFRENARNESVLFADNDIQVVEKQVGSAKDQYERTLSTSSYQFQEAFQDSMLGLKTLQDAVAKATRSRILDYENAYMAENALSSVNEAEFNAYRKAAFEPILKAISRLEKMGSTIDEIRDYLITKHGIERNREMAVKRVLSQNSETYKSLLDEYIGRRNEIRENGRSWEEQQSEMDRLSEEYGANLSDDFSGFTSMYPNEDNTGYDPDSARRYVLDYESRYDTSELSASVKRATDAILAKQRDSGLMSQNTFDSISDMYQFYVPLRGWEETTADEVYAYLTSESQTFNAPIKTVVGRKSKADDPIATIANMAESGIMQGNRNLMKQKFLTMVQNHKTDLVSVSEMWVRLDEASGEWIAVFPDIPSNANPEQVESIVESFNKRMEELSNEKGSNVRRSRDAIGIPYKILPKDLKEHQVIVKRAGKEYLLTINGNPRAAQALNGLTNPDNTKGWFGTVERYAGWLNRNLAANFTTRNPNFMVSNFLRDALYSNTTVWVKESPVYAWKFNKNFAMVNPINMYRLVKGYENGTLDMSDPLNKAYHDFVMRGGETGYTNLRDVEAKKKAIQKELQYSKQKVSIGKALKILGEWMDLFNKSVENCARFAAFLTSREMGRSMDKSIYDAKEISVNFNKKGAGSKFFNTEGQTKIGNASAFTSGLSRSMYVFWNAGVQGMYNFGRLAKDNPKKFLGLASSFYLLGTIMPMLAAAFWDDEDDDYYDLPEYVRRNNICFRNGGGNWITIPMPIELRAIYGLGEMSYGIVSGKEKYTDKKMAMKIAEQMSQVLPLDMMEGGGGFSAFVPSSVKPLIEAGDNKDWTGLPLYKDNDFNKGMPEWTKAFKSVDPAILAMTKYANELTGGDKYTTGTVNLNPAIIEHILDGYFGGIEATRSQMVKSAETAWGSRDFDWRNIPVGNRLIKSGDERTKKKAIDNAYYENLEEMDKIGQRLRGYRKELSNPQNDSFDIAEYQKKLNDLMMSDEYRGYVEFNNLNKLYQSMGEYLKKVDDERLEMELYDLKAMMNEIANGK